MNDYRFFQDLFDTYQSLSGWMQFAWLVVPPGFVLAMAGLAVRFRTGGKKDDSSPPGELIYSILRDEADRFHVVSHVPEAGGHPALLVFDPLARERRGPQPAGVFEADRYSGEARG